MSRETYEYEPEGSVYKVFNGNGVVAVCKESTAAQDIVDALNHECDETDDEDIINKLFEL